jgi:hypothetical protein
MSIKETGGRQGVQGVSRGSVSAPDDEDRRRRYLRALINGMQGYRCPLGRARSTVE